MSEQQHRHLMTVQEAADTIRISKRTYERWAAEDPPKVPVPITIGNDEKRVVVEHLEAWLEERIERSRRRIDSAGEGGGATPKNILRSHLDPPPE